jgi:diketogulonate reductase-like aldo/keto reductase
MTTKTTQPPTVTLNNGVAMPVLGLGVFQSPPEETTAAVETGIADGYRLIDTAASYDNEREVGAAIRASGIDRSEIFVTTKLWISDYGHDQALRGFEGCLRRLGLDHVDLFLLHQPVPTAFDGTVAAYKTIERVLAEGRARAIGVSNFSEQHLENLMQQTEVAPAVNQVELHPFFTQEPLRAFHAKHGIATEAWSPLGGTHRYRPADPDAVLNALEHPTVTSIADKYGKTPAQVLLRWHVEHGVVAIPKSVKPHRIVENFDFFDFALTADEVAAIDALDTGVRAGPDPDAINMTTYPKKVEND